MVDKLMTIDDDRTADEASKEYVRAILACEDAGNRGDDLARCAKGAYGAYVNRTKGTKKDIDNYDFDIAEQIQSRKGPKTSGDLAVPIFIMFVIFIAIGAALVLSVS